MSKFIKQFIMNHMHNDEEDAFVVNKKLYSKDKALKLAKTYFNGLFKPDRAFTKKDFEIYINRVEWGYKAYESGYALREDWALPEFRKNFMGELAKTETPVWVIQLKHNNLR